VGINCSIPLPCPTTSQNHQLHLDESGARPPTGFFAEMAFSTKPGCQTNNTAEI